MKKLLKFLFWVAILAAIVYGIGTWLLFDFVQIEHNDMVPTLAQGDTFLLSRHGTREIGDVLVCEHPRARGRLVIGRLVAKGGDRIAIRRGMLVLNGRQLDTDVPSPSQFHLVDRAGGRDLHLRRHREFRNDDAWIVSMKETRRPLEMRERKVETGFFLLADNRSFGTDSRQLGELAPSSCRGIAIFVLTAGEGNGDLDDTDRAFSPIP